MQTTLAPDASKLKVTILGQDSSLFIDPHDGRFVRSTPAQQILDRISNQRPSAEELIYTDNYISSNTERLKNMAKIFLSASEMPLDDSSIDRVLNNSVTDFNNIYSPQWLTPRFFDEVMAYLIQENVSTEISAKNRNKVIYDKVMLTVEPQIVKWAEEYLPENSQLVDDLVQETRVHVLKLVDEGYFSISNSGYNALLSLNGKTPDAESKLNEQLVRATMESVLDHHFSHNTTMGSRNYSNERTLRYVNDSLRKIRISAQSLSNDPYALFYLATGIVPSGAITVGEESPPKKETYDYANDHLTRRQNKREARIRSSQIRRNNQFTNGRYSNLKKVAKEYGISSTWASRIAQHARLHNLSFFEAVSLIKDISTHPEAEEIFHQQYKQERQLQLV